ncbi:MAG: hypothetical protein OXR66_06440 [Candidatus Woesearchaeota archaeon]|nr:hypothetical protein [Candidatus Woesearchaeota archaeon]
MENAKVDGKAFPWCYNCAKKIYNEKVFDGHGNEFCCEACKKDYAEHDIDDNEPGD